MNTQMRASAGEVGADFYFWVLTFAEISLYNIRTICGEKKT